MEKKVSKHFLYEVAYQLGAVRNAVFVRTLTACVAFVKYLTSNATLVGFRVWRRSFDSIGILHYRDDDECTEMIVRCVDKISR